jgi:glycosyltransferase involved in cell wall biosynthesis
MSVWKKLYQHSSCLIAASHGEGFGLPLIEAARHGVPLIVRDIPVFREVCSHYAQYYVGQSPSRLAEAVTEWLNLFADNRHPCSEGIGFVSWKESARNVLLLLDITI